MQVYFTSYLFLFLLLIFLFFLFFYYFSLVEYLNIPKAKLILPNAPTRPISLNYGHSMPGWSDIYGLNANDPEDIEGFTNSANRINGFIEKEVTENNISPSRIIIGGFSQGGALALHLTLRHQKYAFGGCIAFSTWLPFHADYPSALSPHASSLPIFQAHGTSDTIVPYKWGHNSHLLLKTLIPSPEPTLLSIPVSIYSYIHSFILIYLFINIFFLFVKILEYGS